MPVRTLIDTGPLVAALVESDAHYRWALEKFDELQPPFYTCEAVISEAQFLVEGFGGNSLTVLDFIIRGAIEIDFVLKEEVEPVRELQRKYRDLPMSLADACLVRMSELHSQSRVFTTDSDFRIYRRNRRQLIPLLAPP